MSAAEGNQQSVHGLLLPVRYTGLHHRLLMCRRRRLALPPPMPLVIRAVYSQLLSRSVPRLSLARILMSLMFLMFLLAELLLCLVQRPRGL